MQPTIENRLDNRLDNWARWCRHNPERAHCMSLEHRYTPPQCWESEQPKIDVDVLDAAIVEKAVIQLPEKFRLALKYGLVTPWIPFWEQVRKIKCSRNDYEDTVRTAKIMLVNIL